ncbi:MAG: hypothetical protein PHG57_03915 [Eubacteriales bacterium]|nr:hypothetical protein [Eubacteriales bacterium]
MTEESSTIDTSSLTSTESEATSFESETSATVTSTVRTVTTSKEETDTTTTSEETTVEETTEEETTEEETTVLGTEEVRESRDPAETVLGDEDELPTTGEVSFFRWLAVLFVLAGVLVMLFVVGRSRLKKNR